MEKKIFNVNRKHMRIVLRFLKETGLLPLWQEYFYLQVKTGQRFTAKHWSDTEYVDHVLGNTSFTQFIVERLQKMGFKGYSIHPYTRHRLSKSTDEEMSRYIIIDPITKKTQLIFNKNRC